MSLAEIGELFLYPDQPRLDLDLSLDEQQALHTRTFDVHPILCLECGWHLYGEEYERGVLRTKIRSAMRDRGVAEAPELPDHLVNVLRLADALDAEERGPFVGAVALPAVRRMIEGLRADRRVADSASDLSLKKKDRELLEAAAPPPRESPYLPVLVRLLALLEAVPGAREAEAEVPPRSAKTNDPFTACGTCHVR